ncbi:hypothetical protein [Alloactinosynnema sp. L-07]|uniref:peptidase inhibitor family I36 protein n=1 Tax=Alloactinosynnema sp. L-07 TaxID=1653480 RepID=UPI00065F020C|nr:peptidase inhibitor family I36 protein [Alloactinosynnema sp. L-07]CRK60646.1 hypothetical protein [Alloactinosynnema sp. L-07]
MSVVQRIAAAAAVALSVASVMVGAAGTASAKPNCKVGYYCIYKDAGWGGDECGFKSNYSNYNVVTNTCVDDDGFVHSTANDVASAWINSGTGTYHYVHSYEHAGYSQQLWVAGGYNDWDCSWVGNIGNECGGSGVSSSANDKASSHSWGSA